MTSGGEVYHDRWISATEAGVRIRGYYVPWGSKRVRYGQIRTIRWVPVGALTGRARIWGTANPRYWASLDPRRAGKRAALVLDLGRFVRPYLTPDDPEAFAAVLHTHTGLPITREDVGRVV